MSKNICPMCFDMGKSPMCPECCFSEHDAHVRNMSKKKPRKPKAEKVTKE